MNNLKTFGRILPFKKQNKKFKLELINVLEGELFGDERILEQDIPSFRNLKRTFSAIVVSPMVTVYVCPVEIFAKFVFERPAIRKNLLKGLLMKRELREDRLNTLHTRTLTVPSLIEETESINVRKSVADIYNKKFSDKETCKINDCKN